jgi:hypothetical protein
MNYTVEKRTIDIFVVVNEAGEMQSHRLCAGSYSSQEEAGGFIAILKADERRAGEAK